jgi:CPA1 family monovalent cation:H+ antiporter
VPGFLGWRLGDPYPPLNWREALALTWAGTRGVITLAAVFAIPLMTKNHRPFPDRDLLLLCAYIVVLVTLVGQGLTFGPLMHRLGLRADEAEDAQILHDARLAAIDAALIAVDEMQASRHIPASVADSMRAAMRRRADRHRTRFDMLTTTDGEISWSPELEALIRAQHAVIGAQRDELLRWRDSGRMSDDCLRTLQHELDLEERTLPGG